MCFCSAAKTIPKAGVINLHHLEQASFLGAKILLVEACSVLNLVLCAKARNSNTEVQYILCAMLSTFWVLKKVEQ